VEKTHEVNPYRIVKTFEFLIYCSEALPFMGSSLLVHCLKGVRTNTFHASSFDDTSLA